MRDQQIQVTNNQAYMNNEGRKIVDEKYEDDIIKDSNFKKIMIFGRPGSGKSTFTKWLSIKLNLPLHHIDKYFFIKNWIERDHDDFMQILQNMVNEESWIIDGNSIRSLEMRWAKANLVLYFNYSKLTYIWRLIKRFIFPDISINDRAPGCPEKIRFSLLKYLWRYEDRVFHYIQEYKQRYPQTIFKEIKNNEDLNKLKRNL